MKIKIFFIIFTIQFFAICLLLGLAPIFEGLISIYSGNENLYILFIFCVCFLIPLLFLSIYPIYYSLFFLIPFILFYTLGKSERYLKYIIIGEMLIVSSILFYVYFLDSQSPLDIEVIGFFIALVWIFAIYYLKYKLLKKYISKEKWEKNELI